MSETPRTNNYIENFPGSRREPRLLDFARQLERELADKDRQLAEALAEIERLKAEVDRWRKESLSKDDARLNLRSAADSIKYWTKQAFVKDKLIGQMREALVAAKNDGKMQSAITYQLIVAALSAAAERGEG